MFCEYSWGFLIGFNQPIRYKEHEDGFMRLQLIRYESVELTEQLMREKQKRSVEDDDDDGGPADGQELEDDPAAQAAAAASQVQVQLRGVLLEEQRTEETPTRTEEAGQVEDMLYVLTGDEHSVILQLQDAAQQQGMQVDWFDVDYQQRCCSVTLEPCEQAAEVLVTSNVKN